MFRLLVLCLPLAHAWVERVAFGPGALAPAARRAVRADVQLKFSEGFLAARGRAVRRPENKRQSWSDSGSAATEPAGEIPGPTVPVKLPRALEASLASGLGIAELNALQQLALPPALSGKDVLVHAETGAGKTLCFVLPVLASLLEKEKGGPAFAAAAAAAAEAKRNGEPAPLHALMLSPTLELCAQTAGVLNAIRPGCAAVVTSSEMAAEIAAGGSRAIAALEGAVVLVSPPALALKLLQDGTNAPPSTPAKRGSYRGGTPAPGAFGSGTRTPTAGNRGAFRSGGVFRGGKPVMQFGESYGGGGYGRGGGGGGGGRGGGGYDRGGRGSARDGGGRGSGRGVGGYDRGGGGGSERGGGSYDRGGGGGSERGGVGGYDRGGGEGSERGGGGYDRGGSGYGGASSGARRFEDRPAAAPRVDDRRAPSPRDGDAGERRGGYGSADGRYDSGDYARGGDRDGGTGAARDSDATERRSSYGGGGGDDYARRESGRDGGTPGAARGDGNYAAGGRGGGGYVSGGRGGGRGGDYAAGGRGGGGYVAGGRGLGGGRGGGGRGAMATGRGGRGAPARPRREDDDGPTAGPGVVAVKSTNLAAGGLLGSLSVLVLDETDFLLGTLGRYATQKEKVRVETTSPSPRLASNY